MKKTSIYIFAVLMLTLNGCASTHYVFRDQPVVDRLDDQTASNIPDKDSFNIREYMISSAVRHPAVDFLDPAKGGRSLDVNAMDEVPASSWFEPRLGFQKLSAEQILKGPEKDGPPQTPFFIVKIKDSGTAPGLIIEDSRGFRYLLKFDSMSEAPGYESAINFVSNRLFWAFGYHVPEDHVFYFNKKDIKDRAKEISAEALETLFNFQSVDSDGSYRVSASRYLSGQVLGHTAQRGVRKGDKHDTIAHEDRRSLRALYIFGALTANTGMRSDNTLDIYLGEEGQGYTKHYLLDFGETFGIHGLNKAQVWEGNQYFFSYAGVLKNTLMLGLRQEPWEKIETAQDEIRTFYEATAFDPAKWKEVSQFVPTQRALQDDHYWAVKIMSHLTREHLTKLFQNAGGISEADQQYLIDTFFLRREILLNYHLNQVTPLEVSSVENQTLNLFDMRKKLLSGFSSSQYGVQFYNEGNKRVAKDLNLSLEGEGLKIKLPENPYLRVEVRSIASDGKATTPAEFHLKKTNAGFKLLGVTH